MQKKKNVYIIHFAVEAVESPGHQDYPYSRENSIFGQNV